MLTRPDPFSFQSSLPPAFCKPPHAEPFGCTSCAKVKLSMCSSRVQSSPRPVDRKTFSAVISGLHSSVLRRLLNQDSVVAKPCLLLV
jgi:hypothetical protein